MSLNIILYEPEIPANTGNIGRTCVATGTRLHLIEPLGFIINDKNLKRAGMDYWQDLDVTIYDDWNDFTKRNPNANIFMATTKAKHVYSEVSYKDGDFIMFGKESGGIPEELLVANPGKCVRIPMAHDTRSLNLSNSVAICLYEALRQQEFLGLTKEGDLHRLSWE
ncbi:MAG: tRNA (uridine(34)/cytosine(34)/5-carboxymethylaminomethyluridine(34)-2'-O)-methyltransferase TrmL [Lachnospiraceae bacterium]|nr:tRNA (uridine(34)/cytosine(34)/5-carboxymethylaminomethyluridine(34)-2'-O)-methyltransferase TrmL [Lachnospiraceae bacterium]